MPHFIFLRQHIYHGLPVFFLLCHDVTLIGCDDAVGSDCQQRLQKKAYERIDFTYIYHISQKLNRFSAKNRQSMFVHGNQFYKIRKICYNRNIKKIGITEYYEEVETIGEYDGYFCSVSEAITIAILGSICGLKNVSQIHQWATNDRVSEFLREKFGIDHVPCYYWLLCLLKMVKTESLNQCFANWVYSFMPEKAEALTISLDGKTI